MVATVAPEPQPTTAERIAARVTSERTGITAALAITAACAAMAPLPFGPIGAAAVAVLALRIRK